MPAVTPLPRLAILGTRGIPARYGGFETFAEELSSSLVQRGYSVTVYCEANDRDMPSSYRGVRLQYIRASALGPATTLAFDLRCLLHAWSRFDVVYMLGYASSPLCFLVKRFSRAKPALWINMDGLEWMRSKWGRLAKAWLHWTESVAVRAADVVIADAEAIRAHLQERYPPAHPVVIEYGAVQPTLPVSAESLSKFGVTSGDYFLVVARLEPENHVSEIVDGYMASTARSPLIVVGDHRTGTKYVQALLSKRDPRVKFVGAVYDKAVLTSLRVHCKAYLHGHSVGGTNPSLVEALSCGNVVIAHDNPFNREVLGTLSSYFRAPTDVQYAIAQVDALGTGERESIAARSRARATEHYSWQRITDEYVHLLASVRDDRRTGPVIHSAPSDIGP